MSLFARDFERGLTIHTCGQWKIQRDEADPAGRYRIINPEPDGSLRFYMVHSGDFGQPLIVAEPSLGIPCPTGVVYTHPATGKVARPHQKITGMIFKLARGFSGRFSFSNAALQGAGWTLAEDGYLRMDDHILPLAAVFQRDGKRIEGLDALCLPTKPSSVKVLELMDLLNMI